MSHEIAVGAERWFADGTALALIRINCARSLLWQADKHLSTRRGPYDASPIVTYADVDDPSIACDAD